MATVPMCQSTVKGVWVEGEVYHLLKYVYGVRKSKSWLRPFGLFSILKTDTHLLCQINQGETVQ